MDNLPQLMMRIPSLQNLPPMNLPDGFSVHSEDEFGPASWEWIIGDSFGKPFCYSFMKDDACYSPDRVYFVREYSQDVATAAAFSRDQYPGEGYIHMVGAHSWCRGRDAGYFAVLRALIRFRDDGLNSAVLTTDDFRLPAIATYKRLGFEPVMNDPSANARWAEVESKLGEYQKCFKDRVYLWPGEAPFTAESGNQAQPSIMPFPVEGSKGAVVVCPGGGYQMKASHEGDPIARMLNAAGISAYVLDYRVLPCPFEAPLTDAQRAIRVVRSMGYEKVGILGFSAGGHLTCSAATLYAVGDPDAPDPVERLSSRPDAFIPCYAVVSFASFRHQGSLESMLRERATDLSLIRRFSAELHVDGNTPPAFIWHTANDSVVPVENSLMLASALAHAAVPFELHIFPEGQHGLGLAGGKPPVDGWTRLCQAWLVGQGFAK